MVFETGSIVALVTPFTNNDEVDYDGLHELIEMHIENDTNGVVILGSTGESCTLNLNEKHDIISSVCDYANKRIDIIVGIGGNNTKEVIDLGKYCENMGVDGILVTVTNYNKSTQEGIYQYFSKISTSVSLPIMLYNIPSRCGINVNPEIVTNLYNNHENIVAIKEASECMTQMSDILLSSKISLFVGDSLILPAISLGAKGVVSVVGNIIPKHISLLVKMCLTNNINAKQLFYTLYPLMKDVLVESNPIPIKQLMYNNNLISNRGLRLPLLSMTDNNIIEQLNNCYNQTLSNINNISNFRNNMNILI